MTNLKAPKIVACDDSRWTRRNLIALSDGQPYSTSEERMENMAECDRILIALHRFQTDGKVAYRRLLGMHGGGGGTACDNFRSILNSKVDKDIVSHTGYGGEYPENGIWPSPVPNAAPSTVVGKDDPNRCFAYQFCWHAQPEFLLWHRIIMAEFERGLQDHDPKYDANDKRRHNGPDAVAAPYWAWEGWEGLSLPQVLTNSMYVIKTDQWKDQGYPKGAVFPNPFHRWFAPVSLEEQRSEYFPETLLDSNTTTRSSAFTDSGAEFEYGYQWEAVSVPQRPSMNDVVTFAIQNPNWLEFCTMNHEFGSSTWSIENAHNKFHNHIGGLTRGGIQGPGLQELSQTKGSKKDDSQPPKYTGTMSQNQSIFDPLFFLHHSNVERQLCSWQKRHSKMQISESIPSDTLMERVLYPWTKPELLFQQGRLSWNTPSSEDSDATFRDWWPLDILPYKYDEYLEPPAAYSAANIIPFPPKAFGEEAIRMKIFFDKSNYNGGQFDLYFVPKLTTKKELVGTLSVLSGFGGVCAQCSTRREGCVAYEVSNSFKTIIDAENAHKNGELTLTHNDSKIEIKRVEVAPWSKQLDVDVQTSVVP